MDGLGGTSRRAVLKGAAAAATAVAFAPLVGTARAAGFGEAAHGFSPLGALRYGPDFAHFDYVDPAAPKGGSLRIVRQGSFDTVNTLTWPGQPPADIRLIYDHLIVASDDEAASCYGSLAATIEVAPDYRRVAFALRPEARWHDGRPVTADDVAFTFATLREKGAPFYRQAFRALSVGVEDGRAVFTTTVAGDRDILRHIATIPIHPRHVWQDGTPATPVGSGPYRVATYDPPRRLTLERVADYWSRDLPVQRGRWNFDTLVFDHMRDGSVALEAFKAGEADVRTEDDPVRWRHGYAGPGLSSGRIVQGEAKAASTGALHGLVANLRRPITADRNVRLALCLAWDFAEANRTLFEGAYAPFASVFGDGPLAARGAADAAERAIVGALPAEALADPDPLAGLPVPGSREALGAASRLLDAAGLPVVGTQRVDASGSPVRLRVLATNPSYERPIAFLAQAAARLGLVLEPVRADPATAAKMMLERDFDLATLSWAPARLPGSAERLLWHSALADSPHSYAIAGLRSAEVDAAVEALERAADEASLAVAGRAFDRAFRAALPMVPFYRNDAVWTAWWTKFGRPVAETAAFPPSPVDRWWSAPA